MSNTIISISRGYGSGGRTIGKLVSKNMNIAFYDRNLIYAAQNKQIDQKLLVMHDESLVKTSFDFAVPDERNKYVSKSEMFKCQSEIIRTVANEESCVIIGRCAGYILKNSPHRLLRVFIWAPEEFCVETICRKLSITENEAKKTIRQIDRHRADYFKHHTGMSWTDARNYDLCIDTSRISYEQAAQAIEAFSRQFL